MELDFARAAAMYEAAIARYPERAAQGALRRKNLAYLRDRMDACRRHAAAQLGHA
jgi:hypothetical protein